MLPAAIMAKAIHLCVAGLSGGNLPQPPAENLYLINVRSGAALIRQPETLPDAEATVRDLLAIGADFTAGPLSIHGNDFHAYGVTAASVFAPCSLAHMDRGEAVAETADTVDVDQVAMLLRRAFGARITDTLRPVNARYGAIRSWHKVGQAVDFVPAGGVMAISRQQIRALMDAHGIRLLELLGPGDLGHSNHWHIAFARPGQAIDGRHVEEGDEDWIVAPKQPDPVRIISAAAVPIAPVSAAQVAVKAPPAWDVFASAHWRQSQGNGS